MSNAGKREMGPKCGSLPRNAGELAGLPYGSPDVSLRQRETAFLVQVYIPNIIKVSTICMWAGPAHTCIYATGLTPGSRVIWCNGDNCSEDRSLAVNQLMIPWAAGTTALVSLSQPLPFLTSGRWERVWRGSGEGLERVWRGSGEGLERVWRGSGEVPLISWFFRPLHSMGHKDIKIIA